MSLKKKLLGLGSATLIGLNSLLPINARANNNDLENRIKPMEAINENLSEIPYIPNLLRTYSNWYLADFLMLAVHEQGHYDEFYNQGLDSSIHINLTPYFVNGKTSSEFNFESRNNAARMYIAGFKNTGYLAEALKQEILMGNLSDSELKFKSMLALACELNLPFYLGQHYTGTIPDNRLNDIENFSNNSGISPETMAISSGLHVLANAPYIYNLTKNALGSNSKELNPKPYFLSFRYDGDAYMLYFYLDM